MALPSGHGLVTRVVTRLMSQPAARLPPRNGYRNDVARKSRNRGGASSARTAAARTPAARTAARRAQAGAASAGPAQTGTAQLTAPEAAGTDEATSKTTKTEAYPGQRFGLPERGPGSVSSMPRRVLALFIDWLLSMIIAYWLTHSQFWTIAVFAIEAYLLTALGGSTVGKRLLGIRVMRVDGGQVGFGWALVRTAILLTVVPPLLTDRDLRGLHDRAANTIVVRL
jgi:RDD family